MTCKYCGKDKPKQQFRTAKRCKACWSIYYREWYKNNRDRLLKYKNSYNTSARGHEVLQNSHARNADKRKARTAVMLAVKRGDLTKPDRCITCRRKLPLHGHHIDYSKPLQVIWLCRDCHHKLHRTI